MEFDLVVVFGFDYHFDSDFVLVFDFDFGFDFDFDLDFDFDFVSGFEFAVDTGIDFHCVGDCVYVVVVHQKGSHWNHFVQGQHWYESLLVCHIGFASKKTKIVSSNNLYNPK